MRIPLTVGDFLQRAAHVYPDRTAFVDEPFAPGSLGEVTYEEMGLRAQALALALDDMEIGHGERVAIISPNSGKFLTSFFGVSGYGRARVPINFRLSPDEVAYIVQQSGASVLLYDPDLDDVVAGLEVDHMFRLDGEEDAGLFDPRGPPLRAPDPGRLTRTQPAPSTTPRGPRLGPKASNSRTETAGSMPSHLDGTPR